MKTGLFWKLNYGTKAMHERSACKDTGTASEEWGLNTKKMTKRSAAKVKASILHLMACVYVAAFLTERILTTFLFEARKTNSALTCVYHFVTISQQSTTIYISKIFLWKRKWSRKCYNTTFINWSLKLFKEFRTSL